MSNLRKRSRSSRSTGSANAVNPGSRRGPQSLYVMQPRLTGRITSWTGLCVEAELTSNMSKAHRVQRTPVLSQLPQCDQARVREERTGQTPRAIWADLHQPALEQAPNGPRQFRLACLRPGAPRAQGNAVCNGRVRREVHTQLTADQVALGRCERGGGLFNLAAHCAISITVP